MTSTRQEHHVGPRERFALRSIGALVAVIVFGTAFGLLATLVRLEWSPMRELDRAVAGGLNDLVAGREVLQNVLGGVTDLGGTTMLVWLLVVGSIWLLLRRQPWVALYVVVSAGGAMILNAVVKELVGRLRPVVDSPVYTVPGLSFPSGHAMSSLVTYGVLLLVFGPLVHTSARRVFTVVVAVIVVAVGFTRMALGVHYLSDVLAGWLLGMLWLVLTTLAFRRWRREAHVPATGALPGAAAPESAQDLRPVPEHHRRALPHPWQGLGQLAVTWVLLMGALVGLGLLVTGDEAGSLPPYGWDLAVVQWLAEHRNPVLIDVLAVGGGLGSTRMIMTVGLAVAALGVAVSRDWRPVLFVAVALAGEISLFLATVSIIGRHRPDVDQLNPTLPPTASFPSGHVAGALVLYTAAALLACSLTRRRWRWIVVAAAVVVSAVVALHRLYAGVHFPSDIAAAALLALPWTFVAWRVIFSRFAADRDRQPASGNR